MDTTNINNILRRDTFSQNLFEGVYPRDVFIKQFSSLDEGMYVFNTDNSSGSGKHWEAVYHDGNTVFYFDSYGLSPEEMPDVMSVLQSKRQKIVHNTLQLQGVTSTTCGDYCVLFCLLVARGWSMQRFVSRLNKISTHEIRDHAVRQLIVKLYGKKSISRISEFGNNAVHLQFAIPICTYK